MNTRSTHRIGAVILALVASLAMIASMLLVSADPAAAQGPKSKSASERVAKGPTGPQGETGLVGGGEVEEILRALIGSADINDLGLAGVIHVPTSLFTETSLSANGPTGPQGETGLVGGTDGHEILMRLISSVSSS